MPASAARSLTLCKSRCCEGRREDERRRVLRESETEKKKRRVGVFMKCRVGGGRGYVLGGNALCEILLVAESVAVAIAAVSFLSSSDCASLASRSPPLKSRRLCHRRAPMWQRTSSCQCFSLTPRALPVDFCLKTLSFRPAPTPSTQAKYQEQVIFTNSTQPAQPSFLSVGLSVHPKMRCIDAAEFGLKRLAQSLPEK